MILKAALDAGINYIDTSIDYGESEELIGKYISHRRAEYFLASKCGCLVGATPTPRVPHVFTRENIVAGVNQSLQRMRTDHLDLIQFHFNPSKATLTENDAIQTLVDLQLEGKVRFLGMSGRLPDLRDHVEMGVFDAFQIGYSAMQRDHEEVIAEASKAGAGIIIRGGVARGDPEAGGHGDASWGLWEKAKLGELLGSLTRTEFMLRFTITNPEMDTTIVGTINPDHLRSNLNAVQQGPLPSDVYEEAKRRLAAAGSVPL